MAARLTAEKARERMALYRAGKSTAEIADIQGCSSNAIRIWRRLNNLPETDRTRRNAPLTAAKARERMALYLAGRSDREIAEIQGCSVTPIAVWRRRRGLPPNRATRHCEVPEGDRMTGYQAGMNDHELAKRWGIRPKCVHEWRKRRGLPTNCPLTRHLSEEARAARMLLYSFGYSDRRIAREQGVSSSAIKVWRSTMGLLPNAPRQRHQLGLQVGGKKKVEVQLIDRIKAALPKYLSPADRDDAASDLFLAVMSGVIPIEEIERRAKSFGSKVLDQYASKFGPRSLDAEIGDDGDGFSMLDMLRDDSHSSWLEEMGATAW